MTIGKNCGFWIIVGSHRPCSDHFWGQRTAGMRASAGTISHVAWRLVLHIGKLQFCNWWLVINPKL